MPVNFGLWRVDGETVTKVETASLSAEERLEDFVESRIDILGLGNLLIVGRQVITGFGKRIDLLAIDAQGDLHAPARAIHPPTGPRQKEMPSGARPNGVLLRRATTGRPTATHATSPRHSRGRPASGDIGARAGSRH